jgi:pSer/pThr/pTyr-binding forkhead associated (FHA) protein
MAELQDSVGSASSRRYWLLASSAIPRGYLALGREPVVIGRGKECTLPVFHESISRRHARVYRDGVAFFVEDLGSTNGTFVQGKQIKGAQRLEHDDVIALGSLELRFLVLDATREELVQRFDPRTDETNRLAPFAAAKQSSLLSGVFTREVLLQVSQLIELNHHSGVLRIQTGPSQGILRFLEGQIVEARFASLTAEKAAREILALRNGEYAFQAVPEGAKAPAPGPLRLSAVAVALDILRQSDERHSDDSKESKTDVLEKPQDPLALTQKMDRVVKPQTERHDALPGT